MLSFLVWVKKDVRVPELIESRRRGARVGLTGLGGVKALRSRSWIKDRGAGFSSGVPPARPWVKGNVWGCSRLGVKAEKVMVLLSLGSSYTLRLAT